MAVTNIKTRPISREISTQTIRSRFSQYPSHGLTPERLTNIFKDADNGYMERQAELFEEMEEKDGQISSTLQTRKLAVTGLDWEILPSSNDKEDIKIAEAAKEMVIAIPDFEDSIKNIMDSIGKGYSVNEIMWQVSEGQVWIIEIKWVHPKRFTFQRKDSLLHKIPYLLTDDDPIWGIPLVPNKFIYNSYQARSGITNRGGLLRPCAYMYLFKNYDIKDWVVFNELFSVPMRVGKYEAGASAEEREALKTAVFNLSSDAAAIISDNTIIEFVEAKARGDVQAFEKLAQFCDNTISKVILGHTGSSDSTPGKLGAETSADNVRQDLIESDAKSLMNTLNTQLLQPWTFFNYGQDKQAPIFKIHFEPPEDLEHIARVYGLLVKEVGFKGIGIDHIHERFSIPKPKEGEETVSSQNGQEPQTNKLFINRDRTPKKVLDTQQVVDDLKDESMKEWEEAMSPLIKPIEQLLKESSSLEEFNGRLTEAFPDMDITELQNQIAEAMFSSDVWGRING